MLFVYVIGWLAGSYLLIVLLMYLAQTRLLFPTYLASFAETELPSSAQRLCIAAADGTHLAGVVFAPTSERRSEEVLLVGFGGNVWNVESMALALHRQFPTTRVAGFHYRGYRPSGGRPSAKGVLADALETFDALHAQLPASRTIAIGFSIGTPVAAYLAQHRTLDGLILVTPFDSLVELARDHFRWLPVRALLRHRMSTLDFMTGVSTPTAMIAAGRDSVVPARRTEPLRRAIPNLVFDRVIPEAEHNDLYDLPVFWDALAQAVQAVLRSGGHAQSAQERPP
jgi:uncharacterized protein